MTKTETIYEFLRSNTPAMFTAREIATATGLTQVQVQNGLRQIAARKTMPGVFSERLNDEAVASGAVPRLRHGWQAAGPVMPGPFISISWYNDQPDCIDSMFDSLAGHVVEINDEAVEVERIDKDFGLVCRKWDDELESAVGPANTVPLESVSSLVFY